jgi:hypothetical protein
MMTSGGRRAFLGSVISVFGQTAENEVIGSTAVFNRRSGDISKEAIGQISTNARSGKIATDAKECADGLTMIL